MHMRYLLVYGSLLVLFRAGIAWGGTLEDYVCRSDASYGFEGQRHHQSGVGECGACQTLDRSLGFT